MVRWIEPNSWHVEWVEAHIEEAIVAARGAR